MSSPSRISALLIILAVVVLTAGGMSAPAHSSDSLKKNPTNKYQADSAKSTAKTTQILVRLKPGVDLGAVAKLYSRTGTEPMSSIYKLGVVRVNLGATDVAEALRIYRSSDLVEFAEPNYYRKATALPPNDPLYSQQWAFPAIGIGQAWETAGSNLSPVRVAVLDTGIDLNNEDLKGAIAMNPADPNKVLGKRFYTDYLGRQDSDSDVQDSTGHGTHISGTIAARTNNDVLIAGISSAAQIMPVKVLGDDGVGDDANIAEGLIWAVDNGARVINMSLAGPDQSNTLADAIKYARSKGALIIAATGNNGTSTVSYPAAYDGVVGVGATDSTGAWWHQSNFGSYVDLVAPGEMIVSTYLPSKSHNGQPYNQESGTSMATSFVSGLAAMILSVNPQLTGDRVEGILYATADDLGAPGWDRYYGHGRINAARALGIRADSGTPVVTVTSPVSGTKVSEPMFMVSASASDADGGIAFVEFLLNGDIAGSDASPPYTQGINASELYGRNTLRVVAYDTDGNSSYTEATYYKQTFTDVDISHWAFEEIEILVAGGIVAGYPDGLFKPSNSISRAEFVKMTMDGMGLSKKSHYSGYFKDVPITHWAWPYIESAYDMGLINGYEDGRFLPGNNMKRVEMVVILMRTGAFSINYSGQAFADVPRAHWGYAYVMSARNAGIITGYSGNYFKPEQATSRAEAATIVMDSFY